MRKKVFWKRGFLHFCVLALFALAFTPPFLGQAGGGYHLTNCTHPTPAGTCPPG